MANSIKYNVSAQSLALKTGDFWIGTGDVAKGPTSTTDFWSAINPPIIGGGYTIYVNKSLQGPSIRVASDDDELIDITNGIAGTTYTTVNECFNYFIGQSDKFVLNSYIRPIITEELKFYSDASLVPSYPRNGTSWYDLSGGGNNGTLTNGPTFNSNGYLVFDGVDDYVGASGVGISNYSEAFSMGVWFKVDSTATWDNGYISNIYSIDGYYAGQYGLFKSNDDELGMQLRDANTTRYATVSGNSKGIWYNLVSTWDGSSILKLYLNGELVDTDTAGGITGTPDSANLHIAGKRAFGGAEGNAFEGDIAICNYYKKELSSNEVLQNYYQSKIVTDGLIFYIDAGNLVSYESGVTTVNSLTGSMQATTNGATYNSDGGGSWVFNGTTDYIALPSGLDVLNGETEASLSMWVKLDNQNNATGQKSGLIQLSGFDTINGTIYFWGSVDDLYFDIFRTDRPVSFATDTVDATKWHMLTITTTPGSNGYKVYWDDTLKSETTGQSTVSLDSTIESGFTLGQNSSNRDLQGKIAVCQVYDRALTSGEVSQNYGAQFDRFVTVPIP